jgi:hypothetical protein
MALFVLVMSVRDCVFVAARAPALQAPYVLSYVVSSSGVG